jgi:DNA modification methylase
MTVPWTLLHGDAEAQLATLPAASVQMVCTSPPYFQQRDYGSAGQIGREPTVTAYIDRLVAVFRAVHRVVRDDGTLWLVIGDSYAVSGRGGGGKQDTNAGSLVPWRRTASAGVGPKQLIGVPWRLAFALQAEGWILRSEVIWSKPAPMPESVQDRPTRAHETLFLFAKRERYVYNAAAIAEPISRGSAGSTFTSVLPLVNGQGRVSLLPRDDAPTRNKRSVWTIATQPYAEAHFATFPEKLVEPCILAGSRPGDTVLDPFVGSGTVGVVSRRFDRRFIGIDLNASYLDLAERRLLGQTMPLPLEAT